jgi:hypothetical protein
LIGLVSSTLFPSARPTLDGPRSAFAPGERVAQTVRTLDSLRAASIGRIFVADNSPAEHAQEVRRALAGAEVLCFPCHAFPSRGLNELVLLLTALEALPRDEEVLKVSGRYRLVAGFSLPDWSGYDAVFKGYDFRSRHGRVSTRCYAVRGTAAFRRLLERALTELFVTPYRVVGPRSFVKALLGLEPADPAAGPTTSIEYAMARAVKGSRLPCRIIDGRIGLEGEVAGAATRDRVSE